MMTFFLDGAQVTPPINWQEVASTIKRDNNLNLFLLYQEYDLEFDADGYEYLIDKINNDSFCTQVTMDIYRDCGPTDQRLIFSGILFISDCTVNERNCTIKCKVNDRSFFSKINNNKNIKTSLEGAKTKMGEDILAIEEYDLEVYKVTNPFSVSRNVPSCRIEEAFRYMIDFMTDNTIGFVSDTFGAAGEWNGLCITTGERFRGVTPNLVEGRWKPFSFLELFTEINKRIPIILLVENPYTTPVVRIESIEYLNGSGINFIAGNIDEIETSFDTNKLYALIKFGSPTDDTDTLNFPEAVDFLGFKKEEYHLLTTCNLDQTLDLEANWVVSSNILERIDTNADQGFDANILLITSIYTDDLNGRTTNDNFLNVLPAYYHYNATLNNASIGNRYIDQISANVASYFVNNPTGTAYGYPSTGSAVSGAPNYVSPVTTILPLNLESYDNGGYFDTTLYRYVALSFGVYNIRAQIAMSRAVGTGNNRGFFQFWMEHFDASNVKVNTYRMWVLGTPNPYQIWPGTSGTGIDYELIQLPAAGTPFVAVINGQSGTTQITMAEGDYLQLRVYYEPMTLAPFQFPTPVGAFLGSVNADTVAGSSNTFLVCDSASITGGVFLNVDPNKLTVQLHKFSYPMTQSEFDIILNNPTGRIGFNMNGQPLRYGWIKELKYNHTNSMAEFVVTTNKESQNAS